MRAKTHAPRLDARCQHEEANVEGIAVEDVVSKSRAESEMCTHRNRLPSVKVSMSQLRSHAPARGLRTRATRLIVSDLLSSAAAASRWRRLAESSE